MQKVLGCLLFLVGTWAQTTINVNFESMFEGFVPPSHCPECPGCPTPAPPPTPVPPVIVPGFMQTVLPNVNLAPDSIFATDINLTQTMGTRVLNVSQNALRAFLGTFTPSAAGQVNQTKVDAITALTAQWYSTLVGPAAQGDLPSGYKSFGSTSLTVFDNNTLGELRATIALLFKTNPFYANALSVCDLDRPCLRSRTGDGWFAKILSNINRTVYPVVDAIFDNDLTVIDYKVYVVVNGTETTLDLTEEQMYYQLSALMNYYAECIHTVIHTFQFVIGSGFIDATADVPAMRAFAESFALNVFQTYTAVVGLDLRVGGVLVGGLFIADRDGMLATLSTLCALWGSFSTAEQFLDDFVLGGFKDHRALSQSLGLMTAFRDQIELYGPYANELTTYFRSQSTYQLGHVESELAAFFTQTGRQSDGSLTFQFTTLDAWLQLQAATSLMHAATLSFTRFMATKAAFIAVSPSDNFTTWDYLYFRATAPTIVGAQPGRYIMNSTEFTKSGVTDSNLLALIRQHAVASDILKANEYAKYQAAGTVLSEGWIVADYFPEGWDGRQQTFNTYI